MRAGVGEGEGVGVSVAVGVGDEVGVGKGAGVGVSVAVGGGEGVGVAVSCAGTGGVAQPATASEAIISTLKRQRNPPIDVSPESWYNCCHQYTTKALRGQGR
ncbi:MAG TPA: hypothetical protein EYP09_02925 [Anaerolineae bacterium]|nr:hypothetical protein [Anaerolineae bacterium]